MDLASILEELQQLPAALVYALLVGSSFIEYVVPFLPGDTVVVAGAVLVAAFGWSFGLVFALVTAGAVLGSVAAFYIGRWLARRDALHRLGKGAEAAIDDLVARFEKHGPWYLAVNRFLPGIRGVFFVAAGLAGLRLRSVVLWSTVSAIAWNLLLVGAGFALGDNLLELEGALMKYTYVMWGLIGLIVAFVVWRVIRARKNERTKRQ